MTASTRRVRMPEDRLIESFKDDPCHIIWQAAHDGIFFVTVHDALEEEVIFDSWSELECRMFVQRSAGGTWAFGPLTKEADSMRRWNDRAKAELLCEYYRQMSAEQPAPPKALWGGVSAPSVCLVQ